MSGTSHPYVFLIIGGRKVEHLKSNIEALRIGLTDDELDVIDGAVPFDHAFPTNFLFDYGGHHRYTSRSTPGNIFLLKNAV